ncbi:ribosome maturation factor RimM [Acetobacterium sp.]|uniref:ribosome maturation factor RimM n=1 Tax=Acetobacterium sp. TaxID=1872094 RepID=UPI002F40F4BA
MKNDNIMIIGRILGVHGIKGEIKVLPLTDDPERFFDLETIKISKDKNWVDYTITGQRLHKNNVIIYLEGIKTRNDAEALMGQLIAIDRELAVALSEDEYFIEDLLGFTVYNGDEILGKLTDIMQTGGIDVYIITGGKKTYCIPARKIYFEDFNLEEHQIKANIPQEILEL